MTLPRPEWLEAQRRLAASIDPRGLSCEVCHTDNSPTLRPEQQYLVVRIDALGAVIFCTRCGNYQDTRPR